VQSCSDFLEPFAEKLNILLCHTFIAQQPCFKTEWKLKLKTGETTVICNFSNCFFITGDEVQGVFWNNAQVNFS
jgi:ATP-dependent phosphoenolpyruvate carboxykinase